MVFVRWFLVLAVLVTSSPAFSQVVPARDRGIFSLGQCNDRSDGLLIGRDFGLIYRIENRTQPTVTIGRLVWADGLTMMYVNDRPILLPIQATLQSCDTLPATAYASIGEAIALFNAMDGIFETCARRDGLICSRAAFDFADVSEDERLSLAEVNRVIRAVAVFVSYQGVIESRLQQNASYSVEVDVFQILGTSVFLSLLGPTLTTNLVTSYDFDGDGFLSFPEIIQDREPMFAMSPVDGAGQVLGTAAAQEIVSIATRFLLGTLSQMGGSMLGGMFR